MDARGISRLWRCEPLPARLFAGAALVAVLAAWTAFAGSASTLWKLTATFSAARNPSPSRLYGQPLALRAGEAATAERLADELAIHGYLRAEGAAAPRAGRFREVGSGRFEIARRASPFTPANAAGQRVAVVIEKDRIARLSESGKETSELALDPPLLATYLGPDRRESRPAASEELPPSLIHAVLAAEDATFFEHHGLALRGILRAALVNLRAGEIRQGASTITQQLARLRYLDARRSWIRKLREAAIAQLIEMRSTKPEILGAYLNEIYFGKSGDADLIGVGAAAYALFGKSPAGLDLHESAMLAALIRSPGRYGPLAHPEAARERRDLVLARMAELGWISAGDASRARARSLDLAPQPAADRPGLGWYKRIAGEEAERRFDASPLEERGLTLVATLDPVDQARALAAVSEGLETVIGKNDRRAAAASGPLQAALVSIDPADGAIRAYVGGRDFDENAFDRASRARRPAGSSFKPVVLAAALQSGANLADRLADSPLTVVLASGEWRPRNFDREYRGPVSVREAVEKSLNVPAARLALATGLDRIARLAGQFGLGEPQPLPALALGAIETSPLTLAAAYSVFASGGARPTPRALDTVLDREGAQLDGEPAPKPAPVLDRQTSFLVHSTLAGAVARGTGARVHRFGLRDPLAGKTGTSDDERDSWFAGYSTERATVVWVGYDDNSPTGLPGSRGALPIWAMFTAAVRPEGGYTAPPLPTGIVTARIDPESGLLATPDCPEESQELFTSGRAPVEFCPLHSGGVVYADIDSGDSFASDGAPGLGTSTVITAVDDGHDFAWGEVIELAGHRTASGEPRIVIRRALVARDAVALPVPARRDDSTP